MRNALYFAFVIICLLAIIWPGYAWFGNRIEPMVFGLPTSLMWNVLWIVLSFFALLLYDLTRPEHD